MVLAFTFRSLTSTLFPQRTMGTFSQTRTRSPVFALGTEPFYTAGITPAWGELGGGRTVPVGNILVGDAGCDIKHDDTALAVDVVAVAKTAELLLTGSVPNIELDRA